MPFYRHLALSLIPLLVPVLANSQPAPQHSLYSVASNQYLGNEEKALAVYQQGLNYLLGRNGVERSNTKAANIFRALAERNWSSAQHMLGNMYMNGKGVEQNDLLAYKWLSLASKNNIRLAESIQSKRKQLYSRLQHSLSADALQKVDSWIADWQPSEKTPIEALLTSQAVEQKQTGL